MKPNPLATLDKIDAADEQGKAAVRALFERRTALIGALEARIQVLEGQVAKNKSWPDFAKTHG
jgi:hypothetical protein